MSRREVRRGSGARKVRKLSVVRSVLDRTILNRSVLGTAAAAAALALVHQQGAQAAITHRYSFATDASDSVGTAHGVLVQGASVSGGQLVLANQGAGNNVTLGQYVDLPNNIMKHSSFTVEGWASWSGTGPWQRIFDFGNNTAGEQIPGSTVTGYTGGDYFFVTPQTGNDPGNQRINNLNGEVRVGGLSNFVNARDGANAPFAFANDGSMHYFALTRDAASNTLSLYYDGQLVSQNTNATLDPALINQVNMWLGRSNWQGDGFYVGTIDEFRIYDNSIGAGGIAQNFAAGPNALPTNTLWQVANGNWNVGTNWSTGTPPNQGSIAIIANAGTSNLTTDGGAVATTRINNGTLNINSGGLLTTTLDLATGATGTATLNLNSGGALTTPRITADAGTGAKAINFNGGTLNTTTSFTLSGTNLTTSVQAGGANINVANGTTLNWAPVLTAAGPTSTLTKQGGGTLNLAGGGFDGRVNVPAGTLAAAGSVGVTGQAIQLGDVNVAGGDTAALVLTAPGAVRGPVTVGAPSTFGNYVLGVFNDSAVTVPGAITLNAPLTIRTAATTGTNSLSITGGITNNSSSSELTFDNAGTVIVDTQGIREGAGGFLNLTKNGNGLLRLNAPNTYTGNTTINGGVLWFNAPDTIGGTGASVTVTSNGVAAAGPAFNHANLTGTFLPRIAQFSDGAIALTLNSSENFDFGTLGYAQLGLGAATNVTYTGTFVPAGGVYRLGGGGGVLTLPNTNAITGPNLLLVSGAGGGAVELTAPNDYSSGTTVWRGGTLAISNENQIGTGPLSLSNGTLQFNNAAPITFARPITFDGGARLRVNNPAGAVTLTGGSLAPGLEPGAVEKTGPGTLTFSGSSYDAGLRPVLIRDGTLVIAPDASLSTSAFMSVGVEGTERAALDVQGGVLAQTDFNVGDVGQSQGVLRISGNGIIQAQTVYIGKNNTTQGAVRQTGGSLLNAVAPGEWRIGGSFGTAHSQAVGTYTMTGGELNTSGTLQVGAWGRGALTIQGGTATVGTWPAMGRFPGSYGVMTVEGSGKFNQTGAGNLLIVGEQGTGILNVANGGQVSAVASVRIGLAAGGTGYVNLLQGGTLTAPSVTPGGGTGTFNFHGGTLKPTVNTGTFMTGLANAIVYQGGAVIDTDGRDITIAQPLRAPTGQGLTSVQLTGGGTSYIAHPVVEVSGGGGSGAAAVAVLNPQGQVTGIQITNPGVGYTSAPTVAIRGGGAATPATVGTVAIGPNNTSGGLTKVGVGTLTLGGASTYGGSTTISGGTLKLPSIPPRGTGITNRYDFNGAGVTDVVGGANGQLVNGATVAGGQLVLANPGNSADVTTGQYADLPNGLGKTSSFTVEGWATWNGGNDWQRFFDFGTNTAGEQQPGSTATGYTGTSYYFITPRTGGDPGNGRLNNLNGEVRVNPDSNFVNARNPSNAAFAFPIGSEHHFALSRDAFSNTLSLYFDGQLVARNAGASLDPAAIDMLNVWLGRSNWQPDAFFAGSFNEFRIYDLALADNALAANFTAGPNGAINQSGIERPVIDYLPVTTPVNITAAGATLDLAGQNLRIGSLEGVAGSKVQLNGGTLSTGENNSSTTFAGDIEGAGNLTKVGTGVQTLSGTTHTYAGQTNVNGGTLRVTGSIANSSGVVANTGGTFEAAASQTLQRLVANPGGRAVITPSSGGSPKVLTVNALSMAGGQVDITNNGMVVDYAAATPSPIADIRSALAAGYAGGPWNGPGIITSNAQTDPRLAVGYGEASTILGPTGGNFLGQPVDGSAIVMRHTLSGDADLDTLVDFDDLARLAQNYNNTDGNRVWTDGDFTYDGDVDFDDLAKMAQNYNTFLPAAAEIAQLGAPAGFAEDVARAFAQVPEPGALTVLALAGGVLAGRRRRRA